MYSKIGGGLQHPPPKKIHPAKVNKYTYPRNISFLLH